MTERTPSRSWTGTALWLGLIIAVVAGTALRLAFLRVSHLHVDEYSTIWAALQVLQKGAPVLPSGFPYLQGLLFTYVDAAFIGVLGFSETAARLPSVVISVLTFLLVYLWGRRAFGRWAGLLAASLVALESSSIIWGGRARMYALQQMLLVLSLYAFYRGYIETPSGNLRSSRWRWMFAVAFVGAVLSQTVTILVAPALVLSLFVWRNRIRVARDTWAPLALCGVGLVVAVILNRVGGPVSDTVGRDFLAPSLPWRLKPGLFFREFFWAWPDVVRTVSFLIGFVLLALTWLRANIAVRTSSPGEPGGTSAGLVYLCVLVSVTLLPMIFLVGESWQRPRYLTMLLPVMDLLAAGVLWQLGKAFYRYIDARHETTIGVLVWIGVAAAFAPAAFGTMGPAEPAYDQAFHYVREHWQEGDAVIGPLPSVAGTYLGRCDGYALQNGYEEYLVWKGSQAVDRWTGAPLIDSVAAFERQFNRGQRVWFVIDDTRWEGRYTPDFRDYVKQHALVMYQPFAVTVYQWPGHAPVGK